MRREATKQILEEFAPKPARRIDNRMLDGESRLGSFGRGLAENTEHQSAVHTSLAVVLPEKS